MFANTLSAAVLSIAIFASVHALPVSEPVLLTRVTNRTNNSTRNITIGPANNGTRNFTVGNNTFFNQSNGAEAACTRGFGNWCMDKRAPEPLDISHFYEDQPDLAPEPVLVGRATNTTNNATRNITIGPANNGTRNFTIGNTTFFNQSNGAEAACSRGFTAWCNDKRELKSEDIRSYYD